MPVHIQKDGPVTVVTLSRSNVRNAVDRRTAQELADVFRAFEVDRKARAAVLTGDQGQFCAGADLKKIAAGHPNRVVPKGKALEAALELAHQIAAFPQLCLQSDRLSAIEQTDLNFEDAMANEFNHGLTAMQKESVSGATRFVKGAGRHGKFGPPQSDLK